MILQNPFSHLDCDFNLRQSKRAKRLSISVKPPNKVTLTIPYGTSANTALAFVTANVAWVEEKLKVAAEKAINQVRVITSKDNFQTKFHKIKFVPHKRQESYARIFENDTLVYFPESWKEESREVQDLVKLALTETYRIEAKAYLPQRLKYLADKCGFKFSKVNIRHSKKRWGSCSSQKSINLSLSLMTLPYHLIDYVLLHELCHTIEMNHSSRFYALLDKACGGKHLEFEKEMKQHSIF